jgi:hypothetical protein
MKLKLRIILDAEEDVIRDVEMDSNMGLLDLHEQILHTFSLEKGELASFFDSNEDWEQGEEIGMLELSLTGSDTTRTMEQFTLGDFLAEEGHKMLYVYDYLNLWTFFVETLSAEEGSVQTPRLLASVGERPKEAPNKEMRAENFEEDSLDEDFLNDFEEDDFDESDFY